MVKDIIHHAQFIKAYFSVIRAVASMYNHFHLVCVTEGLELLTQLSESATDDVRFRRRHSMAKYGWSLSTELADYIEGVEFPRRLK